MADSTAAPVEFPHAVGLDLGTVFGSRLAAAILRPDGTRGCVTVQSREKYVRNLWEDD